MAAWIEAADVSVLLQLDLSSDPWIDLLIESVQGQAEAVTGEQDEPSAGLKAVLAEIVARKWQDGRAAQVDPSGFDSQGNRVSVADDRETRANSVGLTDHERAQLRRVVEGATRAGLWVQPVTRGPLETEPITDQDNGGVAL